jgi:hypothetical protein
MQSSMISLKTDGRIIWSQDYGAKKREVPSFLPFMMERFEIEEGATFETFFDHIMKEKDKYSEFFASQLGHYHLEVFESEWQKPFDKGRGKELFHLEVYWGVDYRDGELEEMPCFHGIGEPDEHGGRAYAIEFTPINEFKALPLRLNTNYKVEDTSDVQNVKAVFEGTKAFTVYDAITAVLYEITFCGSPPKRDEQRTEIMRRAEEAKSGKVKTVTFEDLKLHLKHE